MNKYKWQINKEKTFFNILHIPIFSTSDERHIDKNHLENVISVFQRDKGKGYLPRVFIGHNDLSPEGTEREGIGFIFNMFLEDDYIYADIVNIPFKYLASFQEKAFPYVSVEYNSKTKEVTGLAMLASSPPFFKFPPIVLENEGMNNKDIITFKSQDNPEENSDSTESNDTQDNKKDSGQKQFEEAPSEISRLLQEIKQLDSEVKSILSGLTASIKSLMDELKSEKASSKSDAPQEAPNPSAIAYKREHSEQFEALERQVHILQFERDLRELGQQKDVINAALETLKDVKDIEAFKSCLKFLKTSIPSAHPATNILETFKVTESKFQGLSQEEEKLKSRAIDTFSQTMSCQNEKVISAFKAVFPDVDAFVSHIIAHSKNDPSYLDKLTIQQ